MEVHHHTHTERKKWTHYFWEFFMLFLAVTLGFFVENQREHYVDHRHEKQFIQSLFNDIKADTTNLARIINARTAKERTGDSLSYMMNTNTPQNFSKEIYSFAAGIARTSPYRFQPNDGTIQQLKNSGALRLIRNGAVVDSITKYDMNVRNLVGQFAVEENQIEQYRTAAAKIFDGRVFDSMLDENAVVARPPAGKPGFQVYSKRELYEWNYRFFGLRALNKANRRDARLLLHEAIDLLNTLNGAYHLEKK